MQWCIIPNLWCAYTVLVSSLYESLPSFTCSELLPATEVDNSAATSKKRFSPLHLELVLEDPDSSG